MSETYPTEQVYPDEDNGTMPENVAHLAEEVVGHRIASVERGVEIPGKGQSYWGSSHGTAITLDSGKRVFLADTSDCCAYTELEAFFLHPERVDHIITGVGTTDGFTRWHIYADLGDVLELQVGWSSGNPFYYGYGFEITVVDESAHVTEATFNALVEKIVAELLASGASPSSSIHSWRCEYPDRYGDCDCVRETAIDIAKAVADDLATAVRGEALVGVAALADEWMSRIPHQSGAFYPEASAHDNALDIAYESCANDLRAALDPAAVAAYRAQVAGEVAEKIAVAIEAERIVCPVHRIPDCSPMVNLCSIPNHLHALARSFADVARAVGVGES